ncbi:hypothetical protein ACKU27_23425 [Sphingobium yanoikuyae]|uniref:hypothetical protein n=1 Tax=Sphingobium yanoikuyae TaxID=13690 RepID=UPI003B90D939
MARAYSLVDISERAFNRPVMITPEKAQIILGVIGPRLNVGQLIVAGDDSPPVPIQSLAAMASGARLEMDPMPGDERMAARDWNTGAIIAPYETWMGAAIIKVRGTLMAENGLNPSSGATGYDGLLYKARYAHADPCHRTGMRRIGRLCHRVLRQSRSDHGGALQHGRIDRCIDDAR